MSRTFPIALLLFGLLLLLRSPLVAEDDPREAQKKKLAEAEKEFEAATEAYDEIRREIEHDFEVIRGERWSKIAMKFEFAIEEEITDLRADPERDPVKGLADRFFDISIVSQVINTRLAKAVEPALREAAKKGEDEELDSEGMLAAGLKAVFPEETFEECWKKHFMDLPEIVRYDKAEAAVQEAKFALDRPIMPPVPACDGPRGTVYVPKGKFKFGPWTGWEVDLKKNKAKTVRMDAFYIDAFEVSNVEFLDFLVGLKDPALAKRYLPTDFRIKDDGTIIVPKPLWWHPVTGLTFTAANAYAKSRGMRLPTEEEWEYAARGEENLDYPWGPEYRKDYANSRERGLGGKANVGSHPRDRSPCGAYDMAGNVSEMTSNLTGGRSAYEKWKLLDELIWRGGNYDENRQALKTGYRWTMTVDGGIGEAVGFRCAVGEKEWKSKK